MNKYVIIAAVIISSLSGFMFRSVIADRDIERLKSAHTSELKSISDAALKQQTELQARMDAKTIANSVSEQKHYRELRNAEIEINQLRADVDAGNKRLLIKSSCPASADNLPETRASTGMDNGNATELDKSLRQHYFALRGGIERVTKQLLACQDRLRQ